MTRYRPDGRHYAALAAPGGFRFEMWDPFTPTMLAAGALLSVLRQRSGSLAAPVLLHLATNCGGPVAAWAVARRASRGERLSFPS